MNNYNGVRAVGFLSLILGSATLGVCGWLFLTYEFGNPTSLIVNDTGCFPKNGNESVHLPFSSIWISKLSQINPPPLPLECYKYLVHFVELLVRNSLVASIAALFQICVSSYLMASTAQDAIKRMKYWTLLNIGFNLIYLMCFVSPFTFSIPVELGRENARLALANVEFLTSYYIILGLDIFIGFIMLIFTMLMLRLTNKFGYGIMANI